MSWSTQWTLMKGVACVRLVLVCRKWQYNDSSFYDLKKWNIFVCISRRTWCVCVAVFFHYCLLENCFTLHSRFVLIWNLACWLSFQHSMSKEFLSFSLALSRSCSKTAFFFFFCAQPQGRGAVREFLLLLPSLEFMRKQLLRILFLRLSASIQSTNQTARLLDSGRLFFLIYVLC